MHSAWVHIEVDISAQLDAALQALSLPASARQGLALYQAEYVLELSRMDGMAMVDNLSLVVE